MNEYTDAERYLYLAGAADDNHVAIKGWRDQANHDLSDMFITLNPLRGKNPKGIYTPNEIVVRDISDIQRSSLVFAEMVRDDYNYIGTSMEIRIAADMGIPVVLWCSGKYASHYWLNYHTVKIFLTYEECVDYIRSYWVD